MNACTASSVRSSLISLGGIAFGFCVGGVVIALQGKPVGASFSALFDGSFGSMFALGNTLNKAAALLLIACGYIYAAKGGMVSIGAEGQLHVGGLIGAAGALATRDLPRPLPLLCALIMGFVGGGAWGAIAGWLKARRDVNIVISTLLLNSIGLKLIEYAVDTKSLMRSGEAEPQSHEIRPVADGDPTCVCPAERTVGHGRCEQLRGQEVPPLLGGEPLVELHAAGFLEQVDHRLTVRAE